MKPFIILILTSLLALLVLKLVHGTYDVYRAARMGMSTMLLFTAMGHFMFIDGMSLMVPDFIPFKKELVLITAILEILGALGLQLPMFQNMTAWALIVFFILVLPANVKASLTHVDFQKGTFDGPGPTYLWFRVPLQIFFILWVYLSAVK